MIAAEQWYEFQEQYQKYGLDMKPRETREAREARRRAARAKSTMDLAILSDRRLILIGIAVMAVMMIMFIVATAYAASIRYDISMVEAENNILWDDIKTLQSNQTSLNGVGYVEQRAGEVLKMKSAPASQIVYISSGDVPAEGFADVLKSKAFQ
jgi:cell division protein FtsL